MPDASAVITANEVGRHCCTLLNATMPQMLALCIMAVPLHYGCTTVSWCAGLVAEAVLAVQGNADKPAKLVVAVNGDTPAHDPLLDSPGQFAQAALDAKAEVAPVSASVEDSAADDSHVRLRHFMLLILRVGSLCL